MDELLTAQQEDQPSMLQEDFQNESFANNAEASPQPGQNDSFSVLSHSAVPEDLQRRENLQLNWAYIHQQASAAANEGQNNGGQNELSRFHWVLVVPLVYSLLLIAMSCLFGYFTVSGGIFFLLFLLHSVAYYAFRDSYDPIDMLTDLRDKNKSTSLRQVFKWAYLSVSSAYFILLVVGHSTAEYTEFKTMMMDEDHERLRRNEINFERSMDKIVPDFLSYWHFALAVVNIGAAVGLFWLQKMEAESALKIDQASLVVYQDIHFSLHHQTNNLLSFKPFQVQKCVSIFKDYKFKMELFLLFQIIQLTLVANAQYCIYGLPYLTMAIAQILNIAYSHGRSDQDIRKGSQWLTYILLGYLPFDLLLHYWVHYTQESLRVDDKYDNMYFGTPLTFQLEGYQGIMATTPSYVTFGLKTALFAFECYKFRFSYDMGPVYKKLKDVYMEAESTALPDSKIMNSAQQATTDLQQRQKFNQRLKFQYIKIFKKSSSFVHQILHPISLFMCCLFQLVFILGHPSVLFTVIYGLAVTGFFVSYRDHDDRNSFFLRAKIILGIEALYVVCQYIMNVFKIEVSTSSQHQEEFLILTGLGTEQQLGFYDEDVNLFDSLFPFNLSIFMLLFVAVFTRYTGKPSLNSTKRNTSRDRQNEDGESERPHETDDMLTVYIDDDSAPSQSGFSDIRSQRSGRRGGGLRDNASYIGNDIFQNIIEEENEDDDDQESDEASFHREQNQANNQNSDLRRHNSQQIRQILRRGSNPNSFEFQNRLGGSEGRGHIRRPRRDPTVDTTTRGKIRQSFQKLYTWLLEAIDKVVDILIVHVNKIVLLALFFISVSRPTVLNTLLFIMFLVLSMSNHQNEFRYLKTTLVINSLAIGIIFNFDTFVQRDFSVIKTWVLHVIGVQYKSENINHHLVKLKYVPYIVLQCILCLSCYVHQSDKYNQFKRQYMDIDTQKKMDLVRQMALRQQGTFTERSPSKHSKSRPAQSRISKSIIDGQDKSESSIQHEGGDEEEKNMMEQIVMMGEEKEMTINDETKQNLLKSQDMIVMYDPLSKFIIKNAAYFLIVFLFVEVMLLPLSIMNFILLVLMTIIVIKMLYCETRIETYRSLSTTVLVLSIFTIIYISTRYMFLYAEYTININLKNAIENGYHQAGINEDGSPKQSDHDIEAQKTEEAKQQLQHSHDHDDEQQTTVMTNMIIEKLFGFSQSEDQRNQGTSLLSFKLLNLAIVLSLCNLMLNILKHRNLPFLLAEKEVPQDKDEKIQKEKLEMAEKVEAWVEGWKWLHYVKVYSAFIVWFFLPIAIIISTFYFYPLTSISVPSVGMIVTLLILLAYHSNPFCWRQIYRSLGTLLQVMICVCYIIYFSLFDQMASLDVSKESEKQDFQNKMVLWGLYRIDQIIAKNRRADELVSVFLSIVPLFVILLFCFVYKELDGWITENFNISIHLTMDIKREVLRFKLNEEKEIGKQNDEIEQRIEETLRQETLRLETDKNDKESISGGTLGQNKETEEKESDKSVDQVIEPAKLSQAVLKSLEETPGDQVAQSRGDQEFDQRVTNQYLQQSIQEVQDDKSPEIKIDKEDSKDDAEDSQSEDESQTDKSNLLNVYLMNVIEYEAPIRQCYYFKNEIFLRYIAVNNSLNLFIYFGLYAIFNKMNVISIVYWACMVRITLLNFRPNIFKQQESKDSEFHGNTQHYNSKSQAESEKNKKILRTLYTLIAIVSSMIVLQLSFSIFTNVQFSSNDELNKSIYSSLCPNPPKGDDEEDLYDDEGNAYQTSSSLNGESTINKECAQDWSYYLMSMAASGESDEQSQRNIQENQNSIIQVVFIDFLFLLVIYMFMFVVNGRLKLTSSQQMPHPTKNDNDDFVSQDENSRHRQRFKSQTWKFIQTSLFVYFPYFLILALMYVSANFNGQAISDLLSSIYLWFALKYVIDANKLLSKNTTILKPLRIYNNLVVFLMLLFQAPIFLCPSAVDINGFTDPDYINTEDCSLIMHFQANAQSKKTYETKQPMQLYIIISHSVGLLKQNYVNMTILFIYFFTEVQQQLFQHPHFQEYVLKHYLLEKESDGKVRAFMYVERFHLMRLWSYKAIKEEIKLLHKILLRLNDQISNSDFAKNLGGFIEYQKTYNSPVVEEDGEALLDNEENKENEEQTSIDNEIEKFIDLNSQTIDGIALSNLSSDKPVIPLKILMQELKLSLKRDIESEEIVLEEMDEDSLIQYLSELQTPLGRYVYTKNRMDLYNKEGIGLAIALDRDEIDSEQFSSMYYPKMDSEIGLSKSSVTQSAQEYLQKLNQQTINRQNLYKKVYKSFEDAVIINQQKALESSEGKSSSEDGAQNQPASQQSSLKPSSGLMTQLDQDFNPSPASYEVSAEEEEEAVKSMTWTQKTSYYIRLYLWTHYVDHILFFHLEQTSMGDFKLKKPELQDYGIFRLIEASILSRSNQLIVIFVVFNFIMNANLISLFIVFSIFGFSVLENPMPSSKFWKFMMSFMLTIISLKFIYQLPLFCGTPVYTFYSDKCNNEDLIPQVLASRIDYLVGIHKFSGPTSYPRNEGVFRGIIADVLLLMVLLIHKQYLSKIGAWNYVKCEDNIYKNPSYTLNCKNTANQEDDMRTNNEKLDLLADMEHQAYVYETSPWYKKGWINTTKFFQQISNYYGKVLPQYMHRQQKNIDSRKRSQNPYITHKFLKVKPGDDFFTPIFFILLIIMLYTLVYWKNLSGEDKSASFGEATVSLERFSTHQTISLLLILILLLFERMLYRARFIDERDSIGKFQTKFQQQNLMHNQTQSQRKTKPSGTRHTLTFKLVIYYSLVVVIHVYLGFLIPEHQLAPMKHNPWLVFFYLFWCYYFYNSALQIKYGFPMQPYKQAFSKDTSFFTYTAWKAYKAIPFIWEMKVIIDWTVTSTCLDLQQWFKLDDAYNTLYFNSVQADQRKARPEFRSRELWEKVLQGFCFAIFLIFVILAPIFLFSGINPIMVKNSVKQGVLTIDLEMIGTGNTYRIFENQARGISQLTAIDDASWRLYFEPQSSLIDYQDMQKLQFNTYSDTQWTISPPSLKRFIQDFNIQSKGKSDDTEIIRFKADWKLKRDNPIGKEQASGRKEIGLTKGNFTSIIQMLEKDIMPVKNKKSLALSQLDDDNMLQLQDDEYYPAEDNMMYLPQPQMQMDPNMQAPQFGYYYFNPAVQGSEQEDQSMTANQVQPQEQAPEIDQNQQNIIKPQDQNIITNDVEKVDQPLKTQQIDQPMRIQLPEKVQENPMLQVLEKPGEDLPLPTANLTKKLVEVGHKEQREQIVNNQPQEKEMKVKQVAEKAQTKLENATQALPANDSVAMKNDTQPVHVEVPSNQTIAPRNISTPNQAMSQGLNDTAKVNQTLTSVTNSSEIKEESDVLKTLDSMSDLVHPMEFATANDSTTIKMPKIEYKEEEDPYASLTVEKVSAQKKQVKSFISINNAFPKIVQLNAKTEANPLAMQELHTNSTSNMTSIELQLNRQANQIYYWTFTMGSGDGQGGKHAASYLRDTPGVFNSKNTQGEIDAENKSEKRKQSTSKIDKKVREKEKAEMNKKKVQEEQNLVMLVYNEEVIGSFFGNALQLSVVGLYATIVIAIGRFIRIVFDRLSQRVMYEELPQTKQLFEICEGIFIAQMEGDLVREKQLYDLLILMYRSPEALIKITGTRLKYKEEGDSEQDGGSDFTRNIDTEKTITESGSSASTIRRFQRSQFKRDVESRINRQSALSKKDQ